MGFEQTAETYLKQNFPTDNGDAHPDDVASLSALLAAERRKALEEAAEIVTARTTGSQAFWDVERPPTDRELDFLVAARNHVIKGLLKS